MLLVTRFWRQAAVVLGWQRPPFNRSGLAPMTSSVGLEMTLDAARQPGSKPASELDIGDSGEARSTVVQGQARASFQLPATP